MEINYNLSHSPLLFLLLNLMIATIALISKLNTLNQNQPTKSPSIQHQSIRDSNTNVPNLDIQSHNFFQEVYESFQMHQSQASYLFDESSEQTEAEQFFSEPNGSSSDHLQAGFEEKAGAIEQLSMDEIYSQLTTSSAKSDAKPASGNTSAVRLRKSASLKSEFGHFEEVETVEARRPATVRDGRVTDGDAEVDAKADDFINKFREQLNLQRLESNVRYRNIITKRNGSGEVNVI